ncbi:MAG TPA: hypothetical protein PK723_05875 [Candidatus Pacearchaeota archaeon]|nr:hypothetical protein [Candidatus Pacearchaeota archaeon]
MKINKKGGEKMKKEEMERKIEGQKQNQKGGNGMKNLVVYEHECMKAASYHLNKYKHWAKLLTGVDVTKSNGFAFIGEWLQVTSQNQVIEGSLVVEYCGYDGSREFKLYRVTQSGKQEVAAASRQTIVEFIRKAAEELKKVQKSEEEIEEVEEQKVEEKEEKEMGNEKERRILIDFIEEEIMDKGFDEDGEFLINVSDVTNFSDEEIIEIVESLGLCCEKAEGDGNFWISLPEEYILSHQNLMQMYFDNQGPMMDIEMIEVLDYYINAHRKELEEFGCIALDTSRWSYVDIEQIERVAGYLHFDCHCKGYEEEDWDGYITLYPWG